MNQLLKFYHKLINDKLPLYFNNLPIVPAIDIHCYNTREKHKLFVHRVNHSFAKLCIRHELVHYLNELPCVIKDKVYTHSFRGFSDYTKQHFINKYDTICHINDCYVCNPSN